MFLADEIGDGSSREIKSVQQSHATRLVCCFDLHIDYNGEPHSPPNPVLQTP